MLFPSKNHGSTIFPQNPMVFVGLQIPPKDRCFKADAVSMSRVLRAKTWQQTVQKLRRCGGKWRVPVVVHQKANKTPVEQNGDTRSNYLHLFTVFIHDMYLFVFQIGLCVFDFKLVGEHMSLWIIKLAYVGWKDGEMSWVFRVGEHQRQEFLYLAAVSAACLKACWTNPLGGQLT